jgi:hypothetical protein
MKAVWFIYRKIDFGKSFNFGIRKLDWKVIPLATLLQASKSRYIALKKNKKRQALVAHTCFCNPNYWGGRDQEDRGLKPVWANSSERLYFEKNPSQKKGWWNGSCVRPEFSTAKKKKKKKGILKLFLLWDLSKQLCAFQRLVPIIKL